jgi:hypothetical protein
VDDLSDDEVHGLLTLLDTHFAEDGLAFAAPRRDAWFVRSRAHQDVVTVPLAAAMQRPLRARLPSGPDARRWRRWWTEVQMLLHEHPLATRSGAPVNALWFSAAGALPPGAPADRVLHATADRAGDVLRGLAASSGAAARPLQSGAAMLTDAGATTTAIVADPVSDASALGGLANAVLDPVLAALAHGRLDRVTLIAAGTRGAARWTLRRPALLARLWPRKARFVIPTVDEA